MLIIIEGPDCAGKTTLADRLQAEIERSTKEEVLRLSSGPPTGHPLDEYVVPLLGYRPATGAHIICDRLHWGEYVYPAVLNRPSSLDDAIFSYIEMFLLSRGAYVVSTNQPTSVLEKRMRERGDDLIRPEQLAAISAGYLAVEGKSMLPTTFRRGDVTQQGIEAIIGRASVLETVLRPLNKYTTYVGPRKPKRLLLGDVRGPAFQTDNPIDKLRPAFMPYRSMSGAYLWKAMTRYPEPTVSTVGVANACDVDDPLHLWMTLGQPQVVTLGQNARRCWKGLADEAPHPQWVRRFHHNQVDDYHHQIMNGGAVTWN
jgi:thymidylate kinase